MTIKRRSQNVMKRIRAKLRSNNPHCHWCRTLTVDALPGPDMATVDHLKPRRECKSAEEYHAESNLVLACHECNLGRDKVDLALMAHQRDQQERVDRLRTCGRMVLVRTARGGK